MMLLFFLYDKNGTPLVPQGDCRAAAKSRDKYPSPDRRDQFRCSLFDHLLGLTDHHAGGDIDEICRIILSAAPSFG